MRPGGAFSRSEMLYGACRGWFCGRPYPSRTNPAATRGLSWSQVRSNNVAETCNLVNRCLERAGARYTSDSRGFEPVAARRTVRLSRAHACTPVISVLMNPRRAGKREGRRAARIIARARPRDLALRSAPLGLSGSRGGGGGGGGGAGDEGSFFRNAIA